MSSPPRSGWEGSSPWLGLLPTVRTFGDEAPKAVGRALARLLWPAYAVLVVTGFWNISALTVKDASSAWKAVLMVKIAVVVVAGVAVFLHQRASSRRATAVWGAVGAVASVAALCLGRVPGRLTSTSDESVGTEYRATPRVAPLRSEPGRTGLTWNQQPTGSP